METQPDRQRKKLEDYRPPPYLADSLELEFRLHPRETEISSRFLVYPNPEYSSFLKSGEESVYPDLFLDGVDMELGSLTLGDRELKKGVDLEITPKGIRFFDKIDRPTQVRLTNLVNPEKNSELLGLYLSSGIYCTQNEPEGFRRITYFFDRPDVLCQYKVKILSREPYKFLLANGNRIEDGVDSEGFRYAVWEDPHPKPTYLFALVAGDLERVEDEYTTLSGRKILLEIYTNLGKAKYTTFAMESLKKAMLWDEEVFHREYDLETYMIVAVDDFNMGAMENKGLNIFNSKLVLASPETATDSVYEAILSVIAHEYFHNWTGNRITLRDWFQLTLKEGLTVFRDQLFSQDMIGEGVKRIDDVDFLRNYQFPEDQGKLSHPIQPKEFLDIDNFYTRTVYEKGAEVIRMIFTLLGREKFIQALDYYFAEYDGKAITTEDFVRCFEVRHGLDLETFRNWYHRKGTPRISIRDEYIEESQTYRVHWKDENFREEGYPLHFPVSYSLHFPDKPGSYQAGVLEWKGESGVEEFPRISGRPILGLFRGFSAPVQWDWKREEDDLFYLWICDDDPFCRWDSSLSLKLEEIGRLMEGSREIRKKLVSAYESLVTRIPPSWQEIRLLAYLLEIPSLTTVTNFQKVYLLESSHEAIEHMRTQLSEQLETHWMELYSQLESVLGSSQSRLEASGLRALKNLVLGFLSDKEDLVYRQFKNSPELTDVLAGLKVLTEGDSRYRERALDEFAVKWKQNPLVMDNWLSIQASSPLENTLEVVKSLKNSDYFDIRNPNRVNALLGSFTRNRLRFHREDGEGYEFIADCIQELDGINPQSSSRLAKQFTDIAQLPDIQSQKAKGALKRVQSGKQLSDLLYEVLSSVLR